MLTLIAGIFAISLLENPPFGRRGVRPSGRVSHRLAFHLLLALNFVVSKTTKPLYWLHCHDLLPMWVVNIPYSFVPECWRKPMCRAWLNYHKTTHRKGE